MNRLAYLPPKPSSYIIATILSALYVGVLALYHELVGDVIASLAIIPIISSYALISITLIIGWLRSASEF